MKKDEYLNKISQGLKQYDQTYVQEILDDYEEHFQDALSQGQSEEEICQALGDPADLIQEIKNMMDGVDSSQALARPVIEVEKSTKQSHSQKKRYSWSSSAQDGFTLKNIRFRADSADVHLVPSSTGDFYVYTEDPEEMENLEHTWQGNTYEGRVRRNRSVSFFGLEILYDFFGGPVDTVILAIPEGIDDIRIETVSGDISAEDIKSQLLSLTTISGDCRVRRVSNEGTFITTKSGDISIHHTETNHCELKSLSGDMGCKDVSTKKLSAHNISGDVSCSHLVLNNGLIKTISGEISVKLEPGQKPCSTFATSVSGSIHIRDGERTAADEFQRIPDGDRVKITLNSISGDISLKQGKAKKSGKGQ